MSTLLTRFDESTPEADIATDLVKRGLWAAPALLLLSGLVWGLDGAASAAVGLAIVLANSADRNADTPGDGHARSCADSGLCGSGARGC